MAQYKNIEDYRTKKKRKSLLRKLVLVIIIFGILFALLNVLQLFKGASLDEIITKDTTSSTDSFPVKISGEQVIDVFPLGSNVCVLTKSSILTYNHNGKKINTISHGYTNPVVKEGNKKILTYDRGGMSFRVDGVNNSVGEVKLENKIIFGQIASNGNVAIITTDTRYASQLHVYDSNLNKIYQYSSTELLSSVCFAEDNRHILAGSLTTNDGIMSVKLFEMNINSEEKAVEYNVNDILPLDISYSDNNRITLVGKDSIVTFDPKNNETVRKQYTGDLLHFANSSSKETVIITRNLLNNHSDITVYDSEGKAKVTKTVEDDIIDVYSDGSRILVLGKKSALNFDMSLLLLNSFDLSTSYSKICFNGDNSFLMSNDGVQKLKVN